MTRAAPIDDIQDADASEDIDLAAFLRVEQTASAREAVVGLRPSARLVYRTMLSAIPPRTRQALASHRPQLIVLRIPSDAWAEPAVEAFEAVAMAIRGTHLRTAHHYSPSVVKSGRRGSFTAEEILKDLYGDTVCCIVGRSDTLPGRVAAFVDFEHQVAPLTNDGIRTSFAVRFPERPDVLPHDLRADAVPPDVFDLIMKKALDSDDAIRLLRAVDTTAVGVRATGDRARLEDLHGYGEAQDWGLRLVADLASFQAGRITWADVDSGCLLVGPPGTGKTLFASALAESAGCVFLPTSYADWQSAKSGHLGDLMKRMRHVFDEAASSTPSIVFIDEIDTLPARGGASSHDDWWRSITNGLLECLDGTSRREGVIILAACNDGTNLDPALVRSGRLDRRFTIDLPDENALVGIFRSHLGESIADDAVQPIATALAGTTSGADVARIARDARRIARLAGRSVQVEDLLSIALPPETRPTAVLRRVAIHEAGHAVVHMLLGGRPSSLSIVRDGTSAGAVVLDFSESSVEGLRQDIEALIIPILAGRAAEEIVLGSASAGAGGSDSSDLGQATAWLMRIEAQFGLGDHLSYGQQIDGGSVEVRLRRLYAEALMIVSQHRSAVLALAELALERRVLGRAVLATFAKTHLT